MNDFIEVEGPDGNIYEFPEGTTREQAIQYFRSKAPPVTTSESFIRGITDPITGAAQALESAVTSVSPKMAERVRAVNDWLAQYGITKSSEGKPLSHQEKEYQARRALYAQPRIDPTGLTLKQVTGEEPLKKTLSPGVDVPRVIGGVVSPTSIGMGFLASKALGILPKVAAGALEAGLLPVEKSREGSREFAEEKLQQMGLGALSGAVTAGAFGTAARVISPEASTNPAIQMLRREGITPTLGQLLGPKANRIEQAMTVTPILGSAIVGARERSIEDFNRAVANRALRNINQEVPKAIPAGYDLYDYTKAKLGDAYESLLPRLTGELDQPFQQQIQGLRQMMISSNLDSKVKAEFENILNNEVIGRFTPQGLSSGTTVKAIQSELGQLSSRFKASEDYDRRKLGDALAELRKGLQEMINRKNPQFAGELEKINSGYAQLTRMKPAVISAARSEGVFTPEQYIQAIKTADKTRGKEAFARGSALGQEFGRAGEAILGQHLRDYGTMPRTAVALGLSGVGYALHPRLVAAELGALLPYTRTGQSMADVLIASRPRAAQDIAGGLRAASPYLIPGTARGFMDERTSEPSDGERMRGLFDPTYR